MAELEAVSEGERTEVWTCIGKRESTRGTLCQAWHGEDGEPRLYRKQLVTGAKPGDRYRVTIQADGDGAEKLYTGGAKRPVYVDSLADDQVIEWQAVTAALEVSFSAEATRRKAENLPELDTALRTVGAAYQGLRAYKDRAAFLAYVIERVTKP